MRHQHNTDLSSILKSFSKPKDRKYRQIISYARFGFIVLETTWAEPCYRKKSGKGYIKKEPVLTG